MKNLFCALMLMSAFAFASLEAPANYNDLIETKTNVTEKVVNLDTFVQNFDLNEINLDNLII